MVDNRTDMVDNRTDMVNNRTDMVNNRTDMVDNRTQTDKELVPIVDMTTTPLIANAKQPVITVEPMAIYQGTAENQKG
jgi:hypothetical protein